MLPLHYFFVSLFWLEVHCSNKGSITSLISLNNFVGFKLLHYLNSKYNSLLYIPDLPTTLKAQTEKVTGSGRRNILQWPFCILDLFRYIYCASFGCKARYNSFNSSCTHSWCIEPTFHRKEWTGLHKCSVNVQTAAVKKMSGCSRS